MVPFCVRFGQNPDENILFDIIEIIRLFSVLSWSLARSIRFVYGKCDVLRNTLNFHIQTSCARGDTIYPRPARCTYAVAHLQSMAYTPYACGAQHALRHEYS